MARSQEAYDRFSAAIDLPLTVLSLVWLPVLIAPLIVHLQPDVANTFEVIDYTIWAVFVVEYVVRFYLAPARWHFVTHNLLDLLIIAVPIFRPLRALRILRLLNLARVGVVLAEGTKRARAIFTHRGLHFVLLTVMALIFAAAALELAFERHAHGSNIHNYGNALWWAIVTVTTVGYGDKYPVTPGGQGVAVVLMLVGIGLIGVLTATVASFFVQERADQHRDELSGRLDRLEAMLAEVLARTNGQPESMQLRHGTEASPRNTRDEAASRTAEFQDRYSASE